MRDATADPIDHHLGPVLDLLGQDQGQGLTQGRCGTAVANQVHEAFRAASLDLDQGHALAEEGAQDPLVVDRIAQATQDLYQGQGRGHSPNPNPASLKDPRGESQDLILLCPLKSSAQMTD